MITATHPSTLEITTDDHLTPRGDCIVAIRATCGLREFPSRIKKALSNDNVRGMLTIEAQGTVFKVEGRGSTKLSFLHSRDIVVRKSSFVSERTLMVNADKSAGNIPERLVQFLQRPDYRIAVEVSII